MISSENLSFLLGVLVFCGETIIPKGTRGSQLSFKFTIRKFNKGDLIMKTIKFNNDVFITKTDTESIVILNGENDEFWGMEGPLSNLIYDIFICGTKNIENELKKLLDKYEVSIDEIQNDLQDCFDTLVDNNLATYD